MKNKLILLMCFVLLLFLAIYPLIKINNISNTQKNIIKRQNIILKSQKQLLEEWREYVLINYYIDSVSNK